MNRLPPTAPDADVQLEMYRRMVRIRRFEETVVELMGAGLMVGSAHLAIGQEAAIVGACLALRDDDYIVGTHRSHGHPLGKGADPRRLMAELLGKGPASTRGWAAPCTWPTSASATVAEQAFDSLRAPVARVTTPQVPIPFSPALERGLYPNKEKVATALRAVLAHRRSP